MVASLTVYKGAVHLTALTCETGHLEGVLTLQRIQIKPHFEDDIYSPEESEGLSCKCSFELLHFLCKLLGLAGQF